MITSEMGASTSAPADRRLFSDKSRQIATKNIEMGIFFSIFNFGICFSQNIEPDSMNVEKHRMRNVLVKLMSNKCIPSVLPRFTYTYCGLKIEIVKGKRSWLYPGHSKQSLFESPKMFDASNFNASKFAPLPPQNWL